MNAAKLIALAIQASMALLIFSVGLNASLRDITYLLRHPGLLVRSLLAMNVLMPLLAVAMAVLFDLNPILEIALVACALAPVPPILPGKELKAGGGTSYIIGLLAFVSLVAILYVPAAAGFLGRVFDRPVDVAPGAIAKIVSMMLAPLVLGMLIRRFAPGFAQAIARPVSMGAGVLLLAAFVPVLIAEWRKLVELVGNYSIVAIIVFVLAGLAVGHLLGGPDPDNRTVLALSTATRHPAVAMAIAYNAADRPAVLAAVLLVLLVGTIASVPYVRWRRRAHAQSRSKGRPAAS
jgi:BASS family bile acid:Na+ symporter